MSVDLKNNTLFGRCSLILRDDCLVKLEHGHSRDRVRKIMFDRVHSVLIWRQMPWVRITLIAVLLGLPGIGMFLSGDFGSGVIGTILGGVAALWIGWYIYCGRTTIRISRMGQTYDISGVFRPGRLTRFRERLLAGIRNTQQSMAEPPEPAAAEAEGSEDGSPGEPVLP